MEISSSVTVIQILFPIGQICEKQYGMLKNREGQKVPPYYITWLKKHTFRSSNYKNIVLIFFNCSNVKIDRKLKQVVNSA